MTTTVFKARREVESRQSSKDIYPAPTTIHSGKPKKLKRKREPRTVLSWLKAHVSEIDLGMMVSNDDGKKHPIHLNKNEWVLAHFKSLQLGQRSYLSNRWNWDKIGNHIHGYATHYFAGASESSKLRTLFMIDVDCKRFGTREGADAFLKYITTGECRNKYGLSFPNLFHEVSTGGVGGHGFGVFEKDRMAPEAINDLLLRRLQPWLRNVAKEEGFDIELVEVKGTLPVLNWGREKFEVQDFKSGTLAKLPRGCVDRFHDLKNTTVLMPRDLQRLPLMRDYEGSADTAADMPSPVAMGITKEGSCSGRYFSQQTLAGLQTGGRFQVVAEELLAGHQLKTSGRTIVKVDDVAIFLMLGEFFTKNMLSNGAMPTKRWANMWTALVDAEDIDRSFDPKRFKVIRDYLSSLSLIHWNCPEYEVGQWVDGQYIPGKAAKWTFDQKVLNMLSLPQEAEVVSESLNIREGEEHPLWEQLLINDISNLIRLPYIRTIRPIERIRVLVFSDLPEEIARSIPCFESIAA
jgi:hypothetical protein